MKRVIFGVNQLAELVFSYLTEVSGLEVECFTVSSSFLPEKDWSHLPRCLIGLEALPDFLGSSPNEIGVYVCVGYNKMTSIRRTIYKVIDSLGYEILSYAHPSAIVSSSSRIGRGCIMFEQAVVQPFTTLGEGNILWSNALISHHTSVGSFNFFAPSVSIAGDVQIGDECFFGNNATVRNGVKIENGALIGAGCYVSSDVKCRSVYLGPRAFLSECDSSSYETW